MTFMKRRTFVRIDAGTFIIAGPEGDLLSDKKTLQESLVNLAHLTNLFFNNDERNTLHLASLAPSGHSQPWVGKYIEPINRIPAIQILVL